MSTLEDALYHATRVLEASPAALITDIDGTISRIVPRPEDAVVSERMRESLRRLAAQLDLVAVVTAREESVARRMVQIPELTYVGNYGLDGSSRPVLPAGGLTAARAGVESVLVSLPCASLEEKGISFAVHYRNCEEDGVREQLLSLVGPIATAAGARILEGKQVIEVVPAGLPDKATALSHLLDERGINGVVYLGDDLGDIPVFQLIADRRSEMGFPGVSIAVIDSETHPAVAETADLQLAGVDLVEEFLASLAGMIGKEEIA
jgi:trehalose 6-phosphate phosphatase